MINSAQKEILDKSFSTKSKGLPVSTDFEKVCMLKQVINNSFENSADTYFFKNKYTKFSYPILTEEWVKNIVRYLSGKRVIELASGAGWLTYWLRFYGCNIIKAVDDLSWNKIDEIFNYQQWVDNECAIKCVENTSNIDVFILSWPYMSPMAADIWENMDCGQELLYIGEGISGCTADDRFFNLTDDCKKETSIGNNFLSFFGIHDYPIVFKKK